WFRAKEGDFVSAPRSGAILLLILRGAFLALIIGLATTALSHCLRQNLMAEAISLFLLVLLLGAAVLSGDILAKNKQITTISAIYFGLLMGFLLGELFWEALNPIFHAYIKAEFIPPARMLLVVICCYVSVSLLLQTKDEFRFIIPYVEFSKQVKGG